MVAMLNRCKGLHLPDRPKARSTSIRPAPARSGASTPDGKVIESDIDFATYLLDAEGVAVVPGTAFGLAPHFRISYATSSEELREACTRIARFCERLQ